ncbi:hypothetical protein PILCRDRAFT_368967 [Piloderma croceum F 1598]|uniref:SH3 domain-containing protein n=1 Tax=Piloderma croceum (strain F 1598) TaxID=765440 RepID=A0A0C3BEP0_PILCF|nr:hypothetical protein PILCRDRAFT_368967 [Piloderma croceum F 1598]
MSPTQAATLLAHVVSQIQSNVDFLLAQNYISPSDASAIISRLPGNNTVDQLVPRTQAMCVGSPQTPIRRGIPAPPLAHRLQARALWAYNVDGQEPNDLSFAAGDIIDIIKEENDDWWMGRVNGKEALFPSSYVEKIEFSPSPPLPPQFTDNSEKPVYRLFGAAHHGSDLPPPSGSEVNSIGLQQAPGQEEKNNKFGKYKSTLAHSAVGGVGFGAGSAIGGGLVRAIF